MDVQTEIQEIKEELQQLEEQLQLLGPGEKDAILEDKIQELQNRIIALRKLI